MAFHEGNFLVIQITDDGKGNPINENADMNIVKASIEALGGEFKVQTKVGSGSCFRLMLPLTLAIIEGMLIQSGKNTFVIPKTQIQEVNRFEKKHIKKITGRIPYLRLRDEVIPLFNLEEDLGSVDSTESQIALIVKHNDYQFAVGISDVIRLQQVVIKPPSEENNMSGVMGTTILGDGKPSLIIDLLCIYMKKVRKEAVLEYKKVS